VDFIDGKYKALQVGRRGILSSQDGGFVPSTIEKWV
jgi:hypothetical protein